MDTLTQRVRTLGVWTALAFSFVATAGAQVPETLSWQGVLRGADGHVVPDGSRSLTFRLYEAASSGDAIWTETQTVDVSLGIASVLLGSVSSLATVPFDKPYWLGVAIDTAPELEPRTPLSSSPYSLGGRPATVTAGEVLGIGSDSPASIEPFTTPMLSLVGRPGYEDLVHVLATEGNPRHPSYQAAVSNGTKVDREAVTPGQPLFSLQSWAHSGTGFVSAAYLQFVAGPTVSANAVTGALAIGTSGSDGIRPRLFLDSEGRLGINTVSPAHRLDVQNGTMRILNHNVDNSLVNRPILYLESGGPEGAFGGGLVFAKNGTNRLELFHIDTPNQLIAWDSQGRGPSLWHTPAGGIEMLGLGGFHYDTDHYLTMRTAGGHAYRTGIRLRVYNEQHGFTIENDDRPGSLGLNLKRHDAIDGDASFEGISSLFVERATGNVGFGTTTPSHPIHMASGAHVTAGGVWTDASSRTLKENIEDLSLEDALDALSGLQPVLFTYRAQAGEQYAGFIAEDVPDLVAHNDRRSLSPMDLVAVLTRVVQEQQAQIEQLRKRLDSVDAARAR